MSEEWKALGQPDGIHAGGSTQHDRERIHPSSQAGRQAGKEHTSKEGKQMAASACHVTLQYATNLLTDWLSID